MISEFFNQFLYRPLLNVLVVLCLFLPGQDFGLAVIIITVAFRAFLLPLNKKMEKNRKDLVKIAGGNEEYTCILFGGSGTAAMDAVINSVVNEKNGKVLILNNGAYGERFVKIAKSYKIPYVEHVSDGFIDLKRFLIQKYFSKI